VNVDRVTAGVIEAALIYASQEMGVAVRNAAYSPNIKERLDHSCALFDARGRLIAQAEHIPVHLGSLPWGLAQTLEAIEREHGGVSQGEMWVVNDPYLSGTHLNDVTVIRPIFFKRKLVGYAANKAHHADVGGAVPGSISAQAGDLYAEGLVVPPMRLMENDAVVQAVVAIFRSNSRTPDARSGDLRAQIAGNVIGERRLLELCERYGPKTIAVAVGQLLDATEQHMRSALSGLGSGTFRARDVLEAPDGSPSLNIDLEVSLRGGMIHFDYTGTHAQVNYPLNAVFGVTLSGVYYALRAITGSEMPMNEGCFRPVTVHVPLGTLLNPLKPAPVGGGNVETSTRNADVILQALAQSVPDRVPASSGGTMSNVMIGGTDAHGRSWAFYETIGCGMGARPTLDGIDGIQCHMTNTLNTPIEAIEREMPLRVTGYEFAAGTGGAGRRRGGDGLIRRIQLVEGTARATLLADRQNVAPPGARGGKPGACGVHRFVRAKTKQRIAAKTTLDLEAGDAIEVQTPGGGGYGPA
jgi:N-methylhydantoinase B